MNQKAVLRVFFDGDCRLCSTEIDHYKKVAPAGSFLWEDISRPNFRAQDFGFEQKDLMASIHCREEPDGPTFEGMESFLAIWSRIPRYRPLQRIASLPLVLPVLKGFYWGFALVRPYLPRRKGSCETQSCERKGSL
jgi:predicted DCC family thiol-disulfide oxidoreductase YuxK